MMQNTAGHLGVNDSPKAKALKNNGGNGCFAVNAAGTSADICAETVPTGLTLQPDQALSLLAERHPQLSPHIRKLRAAVARGDKVRAAQLMAGLEIAVEVFEAPAKPTSPVQPDKEDS